MTKLDLVKLIKEEKNRLNSEYTKDNKENDYYKKLLEEHDLYTSYNYDEINIIDLLTAYVHAKNHSFKLEDIEKTIASFKDIIENESTESVTSFCEAIGNISENNKVDEIKNALKSRNKKKKDFLLSILKSLLNETDELDGAINLIEILEKTGHEIIPLLTFFEEDEETMRDCFSLLLTLKTITDEKNLIRQEVRLVARAMHTSLSEEELENQARRIFKVKFNIEQLKKEMDVITDYATSLQKIERNLKRKASKELKIYDEFLNKFLLEYEKEEIKSFKTLVEKVPNEEIRKVALQLIYEKNTAYQTKLQEKYQELSENSLAKYQVLLEEYGITKDMYYDDLITKNNFEDTKFILITLKNLNLTSKRKILAILENSNKEQVQKVLDRINNRILTSEYVIENEQIFFEDNNLLEILDDNIKYLKEKNISVNLFVKTQEVLFEEPQRLHKNLEVLKSYNLTNLMIKNINYKFLSDENLIDKLDTILELGLEKYLEEDLELLNYDIKVWDRIKILNQLNIVPIESLEELKSILETNKFLVPDDKINEYLEEAQEVDLSFFDENEQTENLLQQATNTKRTYQLNDINFSINKVKRNIESFRNDYSGNKLLIKGLITNRNLTKEQYEELNNYFKQSQKIN